MIHNLKKQFSRVSLGAMTVVLAGAQALIASPAMAATETSIWGSTATPATATYSGDTDSVTLGTRFHTDRDGQITAIKVYRGTELAGDTKVYLYSPAGNLLGSGTLTKPSTFTAGWRTVALSTPVNVTANSIYTAAYLADNGQYAINAHYFCAGNSVPSGIVSPQLDTNCAEVPGHNGVFHYGSTASNPTDTYQESNYWVDPVFSYSTTSSMWSNSTVPTNTVESDTDAVMLGNRFHTNTAGQITAVKVYRGAELNGDTKVYLWDDSGNQLGSGTLAQPAGFEEGWRTVSLDEPVTISANTTYVAGYYADNGRYAADNHYFCPGGSVPSGVVTPEFDTNCAEVAGHNGVYAYTSTAGTFPTDSYQESNYWIDVVFAH
jgi:hypothetical protein